MPLSGEFLIDDATVEIEPVASVCRDKQNHGSSRRAFPARLAAAAHIFIAQAYQLPLLCRWPAYFTGRDVDDRGGAGLAGLPVDWLPFRARPRRFFRRDSHVVFLMDGRGGRRPHLTARFAHAHAVGRDARQPALAALVFAGVIQPWHIILIAFLLGINNSFDITARQTFVKDMVGKEDMLNAIALNSAIFNLSRIIGPTLAGIALALAGPGYCFLITASPISRLSIASIA